MSVVASFGHKEIAPVKKGPWGNHQSKPHRQEQWEKDVRNEVENIIKERVQDYYPYMQHVPQIAELNEDKEDCRPRLFDPQSKQWMLVDSCAQVSVWPKTS